MPLPANEPSPRGQVITQVVAMAQTLNRLDSDMDHGNILAAREASAGLRAELTTLARILGLA